MNLLSCRFPRVTCLIMSKLKKVCHCFSRSYRQRHTLKWFDFLMTSPYYNRLWYGKDCNPQIYPLRPLDWRQPGRCWGYVILPSQNPANIAVAGVTRWQHYLYSYKSICMGIVQPFEEVCLALWRSFFCGS